MKVIMLFIFIFIFSFKGCLLTEPMQGTWHLAAESGFVSKHDMTQGDVTRLKEIAQTIKSPV